MCVVSSIRYQTLDLSRRLNSKFLILIFPFYFIFFIFYFLFFIFIFYLFTYEHVRTALQIMIIYPQTSFYNALYWKNILSWKKIFLLSFTQRFFSFLFFFPFYCILFIFFVLFCFILFYFVLFPPYFLFYFHFFFLFFIFTLFILKSLLLPYCYCFLQSIWLDAD